MKDKYYTPSIEEFHVGFEFELKDPITQIWVKFIFEEDKLWFIKSNISRVKYLNKEDIESLGFELIEEDIKNPIFNKQIPELKQSIHLQLYNQDNQVSIVIYNFNV